LSLPDCGQKSYSSKVSFASEYFAFLQYASDMGTIRDKKKASTMEALLDSAKRLFDEHGFDKTTVDDIAEAAVISKFTFYNYFQSKEELLDELHRRGLETATASGAELLATGAPITEVLLQQAGSIADWYEQNPELAMVLLNQRRMPLLFKSNTGECMMSISSLIEMGQRNGELNSAVSSQDITKYMYLIAFGEKMSWVQSGCNYSLREKMIAATNFLLKALKPE
jgi:AcrR family transcriptional regulator